MAIFRDRELASVDFIITSSRAMTAGGEARTLYTDKDGVLRVAGSGKDAQNTAKAQKQAIDKVARVAELTLRDSPRPYAIGMGTIVDSQTMILNDGTTADLVQTGDALMVHPKTGFRGFLRSLGIRT